MQGDCRTILHVWPLFKRSTAASTSSTRHFSSLIPSRNKNGLDIALEENHVCSLVKEGSKETHPRAAEGAGGEAGRGSADGSRPVGTESGGGVRR